MRTYVLLASSGSRPNIDPDIVKPGWGALGLVVLLGIVLALLLWNFTKQLKKVDFVEEPDPRADRTASTDATDEPRDEPRAGA